MPIYQRWKMYRKKHIQSLFFLVAVTILPILASLSACSNQSEQSAQAEQATYSSNSTKTSDDQEVLDAQSKGMSRVHVTFSAVVYKLLPDDTKGIPHQRFLLRLSNNTTVLIAHNTNLGSYLSIQPGDMVEVSGEYIWNKKGGLVHYTHPSTSTYKEGGWIKVRSLTR